MKVIVHRVLQRGVQMLEGDSADVSTGILEREIVDGTTVRQHDDISVVRKKTKGKLLAAAIGVVALIVVGVAGKIYVDQVERERQEQARLGSQIQGL